jgi:hypothetical protein
MLSRSGHQCIKFRFLFLLSVVFFFSACGLKYVPTETPEEFEARRHAIVEKYIQESLASQKLIYSSVAFGETVTLKPSSFKKLDSLYAIKYQNEELGKLDSKLEEQIEIQRMIVQNDTNKVAYIEDHVFSLAHGDTLDFYSGLFQLNQALAVIEVIIKESVYIPNRYDELYQIYLFEESFFYPGNLPNGEELNFYQFFKEGLNEQTVSEKDAFILHTLKLMELAKVRYTIKTSDLLKMQVSRKFLGSQSGEYSEKFSEILELNQISQNGEPQTVGYTFQYSYSENTENVNIYNYQITFDQYLRLKESVKL